MTTTLTDAARLHALMDGYTPFGGTPDGGMHRLTLSAEDGAARDHLVAWMKARDLKVTIDPIGNVFGLLDWAGPEAPTVMIGSHLDSQPKGGRFDGAYGVQAACEAVVAIKAAAAAQGVAPKCNIAVVDWTNEEGARFQPSLLGSSVYAKLLELPYALAREDGDCVSVSQSLAAIGYAGTGAFPYPQAYIELHIEGDTLLETSGERFGAITSHWGAVKYRLAFIGRQAHTAPTPMVERRDAGLAAAHLMVALRALADATDEVLHTSVGRLEVYPNSPNTVPGEAVMFIELRAPKQETLDRAETGMLAEIEAICGKVQVSSEVRSVDRRPVGYFDRGLYALAEQEAAALGHKTVPFATIGAHDAIPMISVCPSVVIVIPSVGGVIHHPSEFSKPEDTALGAEILTRMVWRLCRDGLAAIPAVP